MLITGTRNQSANFELYAFQFAKPVTAEEDWLEISLNLEREDESWKVIDPSLTAAEVMSLASWLNDIACNRPVEKDLYFLEPNLSFHFLHGRHESKMIKISFNGELIPPWQPWNEEYVMLSRMDDWQLQRLAAGLFREVDTIYAKAGFKSIPWGDK